MRRTIDLRQQLIVLLTRLPGHTVQVRTQYLVLLRQTPFKVLLIHDLLCHLVRPELQSPPSAFHDDGRAQTAQNARLVVFAGVEGSHDRIVRIEEVRCAGRAFALAVLWSCGFEAIGAGKAEDVAEED